MLQPHSIRAIAFDLDGTLLDRHRMIESYALRLCNDFRVCRTNELVDAVLIADSAGYASRLEFVRIVRRKIDWRSPPPSEAGLLAHWRKHFAENAVLRAGAIELISTLQRCRIKLAVITNGNSSTQMQKLRVTGIDGVFDAIVSSTGCGSRKPKRQIFLATASKLFVHPNELLLVGDHPIHDVRGGNEAGLATVWIGEPAKWPNTEPPPLYGIRCLRELDELLPEFGIQKS